MMVSFISPCFKPFGWPNAQLRNSKFSLPVIPAQAGIQIAALDSRLRGNDGTKNQGLTTQQSNVRTVVEPHRRS
jgi:hypothetical protein